MRSPAEYWASGAGLSNITPKGKAWPEGEAFPDDLRELLSGRSVLEFGCGIGRLANLFAANLYVGVDICTAAVERARIAAPHHGPDEPLPAAEITLCHTVLLHIPDDLLPTTIARFRSPRVIVSEILGRHWRRDGDPPVFNREADDYHRAFDSAGYRQVHMQTWPYPHYRDTDLTLVEFDRT